MGQELVPSMDQRNLVVPAVEQELDLRVYLNVLRRRYLFLIIPAVTIFAAICAVTFSCFPGVSGNRQDPGSVAINSKRSCRFDRGRKRHGTHQGH